MLNTFHDPLAVNAQFPGFPTARLRRATRGTFAFSLANRSSGLKKQRYDLGLPERQAIGGVIRLHRCTGAALEHFAYATTASLEGSRASRTAL